MGNQTACECATARDEFDTEGEAIVDATVFLNVYDLNEDWLRSNKISNDVLRVGGAFHAGVQVYGQEWCFGNEGITSQLPRSHDVHVFRHSVAMGETMMSAAQVAHYVTKVMSVNWDGNDYNLFERNCCSFADALCRQLVGKELPGLVTRFPRIAASATQGLNKLVEIGDSVSTRTRNESVDSTELVVAGQMQRAMQEFEEEKVGFFEDQLEPASPRLLRSHSMESASTTVPSEIEEVPQLVMSRRVFCC